VAWGSIAPLGRPAKGLVRATGEQREAFLAASLAVEREEKAQLRAELAEARKPALLRLLEALRRR